MSTASINQHKQAASLSVAKRNHKKRRVPKVEHDDKRDLALCEEAWQHIESTGITYTIEEMRANLGID